MPTYTQLSGGYMRIGSAADRLGVGIDTLRRWCDEGKVAHWRTPGGQRLIATAAVDELLALSAPATGEAS